jgi:hypothetical protein
VKPNIYCWLLTETYDSNLWKKKVQKSGEAENLQKLAPKNSLGREYIQNGPQIAPQST